MRPKTSACAFQMLPMRLLQCMTSVLHRVLCSVKKHTRRIFVSKFASLVTARIKSKQVKIQIPWCDIVSLSCNC